MKNPRSGMLSKGGKLPVGSVRIWGGVKYRKFSPGDWRPLVEGKEPWDSSDEKAKELKLSDFGTPDEVREMAKMPRTARDFTEAKAILGGLVDKPLTSKGGLVAFISKNSAKEILSGKAVNSSFERSAHLLAAANADRLFSNAIEPWKFGMNPEKANEGLKAIRRLYSPMFFNEKIITVKLTVKEIKNKNEGNRIYSLKAMAVDLEKNIGGR
jgi:hypothetical protein